MVKKRKRTKRAANRRYAAPPSMLPVKMAGSPWLAIGDRRYRVTDVARRSRLSIATIYRVFCAEGDQSIRNVTWATMQKIADGCAVGLDDVAQAIREARKLRYKKATTLLDRPDDDDTE